MPTKRIEQKQKNQMKIFFKCRKKFQQIFGG